MMDWIDDPWIGFAAEMAEDFFRNHKETMPEDPHRVWDENEVGYFCFAFAFWAAQSKFKFKKGAAFNDRARQYNANVERGMNDNEYMEQDDSENANYDVYKARKEEYVALLTKGTSSFFAAITRSPFKRACKAFVSHACKRYIFSESDLVKIIHPWLLEKGMEFDKKIDYA